jgi:hypothetical protein
MGELKSNWSLLQEPGRASALRFTFQGEHDSSHGNRMIDSMTSILKAQSPSMIVFDLLDYDYVFGNDVVGFFMVAIDQELNRLRPVCLLAQGRTSTSLQNLFPSGQIDTMIDVTFVETNDEAARWLQEKADEIRSAVVDQKS